MADVTVLPPKIHIELSVMEAAHLGAFLQHNDVGFEAEHLFNVLYTPLLEAMRPLTVAANSGVWFNVSYAERNISPQPLDDATGMV